jgi:serine/threonine protein kinase
MKDFFKKLFGKRPVEMDVPKNATAMPASYSNRQVFEPFKKGDVIGGTFEVLRPLGEGGFGVVYLVRHRESGGLFALKTFRDEFLADPKTREAFKREASLWSNLQTHPCVVAARWVQEIHGRLFVMMDYVPADSAGRVSLGDYLGNGPIDANTALKWGIQFCQGMEHAAAHGIRCHRDIKPANILIAQDGTLKVSDFGLVAPQHKLSDRERLVAELCQDAGMQLIVERSKEKEHLYVGQKHNGSFGFSVVPVDGNVVCGTPGYMAPEVFRGEMADLRSDVYSFGLVLWQMATGRGHPPFTVKWRGDMGAYLRGIYEQQISGRVPAVESPLSAIIDRCLRPSPSERYSDFSELRRDLEAIFERRTNRRVQAPQSEEQSAVFWSNRGGSLCSLGRFEEAIACFDKALALEPEYGHALSNKGVVLYSLGRNRESLQSFERALQIDPSDAMAWCNAGNVLSTLGRHEDASRYCD